MHATNGVNAASNAVVGVYTAVRKFQTGDAVKVLSGVLDITASVAGFAGPHGVAVAAVAGLINNVLGLFGAAGPTMQQVIGDMMKEQTRQMKSMFRKQAKQIEAGFNNVLDQAERNVLLVIDNDDANTKNIMKTIIGSIRSNQRTDELQKYEEMNAEMDACMMDWSTKLLFLDAARNGVKKLTTIQNEIKLSDGVKDMTRLRGYSFLFCSYPRH